MRYTIKRWFRLLNFVHCESIHNNRNMQFDWFMYWLLFIGKRRIDNIIIFLLLAQGLSNKKETRNSTLHWRKINVMIYHLTLAFETFVKICLSIDNNDVSIWKGDYRNRLNKFLTTTITFDCKSKSQMKPFNQCIAIKISICLLDLM